MGERGTSELGRNIRKAVLVQARSRRPISPTLKKERARARLRLNGLPLKKEEEEGSQSLAVWERGTSELGRSIGHVGWVKRKETS